MAETVLEITVDRQAGGIVGLDLAGDEIHYPITNFIDVFQWAKKQGLHVTIHAAEAGPPGNIKDAIEKLGAERIGHGVRAREDIAIMDLLNRKQVTLEICPTSNLQTGIIPKLGQHPLLAFYRLGIPVTVNTDDPSISNITLTDEFLVATVNVGVPFRDLCKMVIFAAQAAFLPEAEKAALVDWFRTALKKYVPDLP